MKNNGLYAGGEAFDRVFRALGDPHRIQIIRLLRERELSAGEILEAVDIVQSTLSHHMKTLSESGVVNAVRQGKWTYYVLNESVFSEAVSFLEEYTQGTRIRKTEKPRQLPSGKTPDPDKEAEDLKKEPAAPRGSSETKKKKDKDKKGKKNKKNKKKES